MRQLQCSATLVKNAYDRTGTLILIWTEDSEIYRAEIPNGRLLPGQEDEVLNNAIGEHIPKDHFFPRWDDALTEAQQPVSPDIYVKKHYSALLPYNGTPSRAPAIIMTEVKALETISKKPHPNVNKYLGCIRDGDFVGGICLEKLDVTLGDLVNRKIPEDRAPPLQPEIIISGIKAGLDHIHSFGLVHDDINPSNVMLDQSGNPVIVDFDSCVVVGAPSRGGTPGWSQCPKVAAFENDFYGLDLVVKFIRGEYDGQDVSAFFDDKPQEQPRNGQETDPHSCGML